MEVCIQMKPLPSLLLLSCSAKAEWHRRMAPLAQYAEEWVCEDVDVDMYIYFIVVGTPFTFCLLWFSGKSKST